MRQVKHNLTLLDLVQSPNEIQRCALIDVCIGPGTALPFPR